MAALLKIESKVNLGQALSFDLRPMNVFSFPIILIRHWSCAWLLNFFISLFFFTSILLVFTVSEDFQKYLTLLENDFIRFFNVIFLPFLPWLIPICCFTGTTLTFFIFEKHLEWSSLKSCSISPISVIVSVLSLSFVVSVLQFYITILVPSSSFENLDAYKEGFMMKVDKQSSWYFQSFDAETFEGRNLQVYLYDSEGNDALRIRCEKAFWHAEYGWSFQNGVYLSFKTTDGLPVPNLQEQELDWITETKENIFSNEGMGKTPLRKLRFTTLKLKELNENPKPYLLLSEKPKNLTLQKLKEVISELSHSHIRTIAPYRFRLAQVCIGFFSSIFATVCALILVTNGARISFPKIFSIILIGMVAFYVSANFATPLGQMGVLNEWLAAIIPYISVLLLLLINSRWGAYISSEI